MEITEKKYNKLVYVVTGLKEENNILKRRIEKLENELRKYKNENTPSSMIPPFLKNLEKDVDKEIKNAEKKEDNQQSKYNARNSRPKPDKIEIHKIDKCPDCGKSISKRKRNYKRIIIDIKSIEIETTEHISETGYCQNCKRIVKAKVPDTLPNMKYGINVISLISVMSIGLNSTTESIAFFLNDIMGIKMSKATVCNIQKSLKEYLQNDYKELEKRIKKSSVRYKDETSYRYNGKNFWNWVIATSQGIIYKIERRRSHKFAKQMEIMHGVDVTDGYAGYNGLGCKHQRCWAHMLRKAKSPPYSFGENENYQLYKENVNQLLMLFHSAKASKNKYGASEKLRKRYEIKIHEFLDKISTEPMGRNITKLINYIMKFEGEWFTFLEYNEVEPTNNIAERALRPVVIRRKISQQSRGIENMKSYTMQASMFMTLKQQDKSYSQYLINLLSDYPHGNKS